MMKMMSVRIKKRFGHVLFIIPFTKSSWIAKRLLIADPSMSQTLTVYAICGYKQYIVINYA